MRARSIGIALLAMAGLSGVAPAAEADRRFELTVVGVYRPVDLQGRTVQAPREIYLRARPGTDVPLTPLVGRTLTVHRLVEVPALVSAAGPRRAVGAAPKAGPPAVKASAPKPTGRRPSKAVARMQAEAAAKAAAKSPAVESPSEAPPAPETVVKSTAPAPALTPTPAPNRGVRVERPMRPRVPTTRIEVLVGRVEVVEVRGAVAVARVVEDGVGPGGGVSRSAMMMPPAAMAVMGTGAAFVDLPAVIAGDIARLAVEPVARTKSPPLSDAESKALEEERASMEKDLRRRNTKRKPYEREVMRWKL